MLRFGILGPVEVWAGERPLAVGGPLQVSLLAFLLLNANRAVPGDAVIDAVWGAAPVGADKRLHMAIARLRRAIESPAGAAERRCGRWARPICWRWRRVSSTLASFRSW
jgi:DNA-binding SARP family transcriptional activator